MKGKEAVDGARVVAVAGAVELAVDVAHCRYCCFWDKVMSLS